MTTKTKQEIEAQERALRQVLSMSEEDRRRLLNTRITLTDDHSVGGVNSPALDEDSKG